MGSSMLDLYEDDLAVLCATDDKLMCSKAFAARRAQEGAQERGKGVDWSGMVE